MNRKRTRIVITGAVQGVGFRPFVYRLAHELHLNGCVANSPQGVLIEIEGEEHRLQEFQARLQLEKPPLAFIEGIHASALEPTFDEQFKILDSEHEGAATALILPDIATCRECLREVLDPQNRRHLYPFTNCTHCGPRFSIIESLPYDRANTSMKQFAMCADCEREYHDPVDRRFHAQPNACPKCGPQLKLWDDAGAVLNSGHDALLQAVAAIRDGQIVALKGIGGFQLLVDARNEDAVRCLRARKRREEKPFAVMFPLLSAVEGCCRLCDSERTLLQSSAAPIVLLKKLSPDAQTLFATAPGVAPGNPSLGVMLPYSPLHHLVLRELGFPVVATSGNASDEPICTEEREALQRLRGIADVFLTHNRPIVRPVDDSVVRVMLDRELILRRARGYAPMPVQIEAEHEGAILAVGAHLKNAVALNARNRVFISQHIGDLETPQALSAFRKIAADLPRLYDVTPEIIAHDLHPDYVSTKFARQKQNPTRTIAVQHHYAHILSCMAENKVSAPALGVAWDGTGLGTDGTVWGGEFLRINQTSFDRFAHFRQFRLPGGDAAMRQPRRAAIGLLHEIFGEELFSLSDLSLLHQFSKEELRMMQRMLARKINSPLTSSAGRFFDAMASILGVRQRSSFEGHAAMELEFACGPSVTGHYPIELWKRTPLVFDWEPAVLEMLKDIQQQRGVAVIAAKLHNTLVEVIVAVSREAGEHNVVLSGGCFQNQHLTERAVRRLREEGFVPFWHRQVPPNDGGIALGQIVAAIRSAKEQPAELDHLTPKTTEFTRKETHVSGHSR